MRFLFLFPVPISLCEYSSYSLWQSREKNRSITKSVTVPAYLNELAMEAHINFSSTLQEALKEKLGV